MIVIVPKKIIADFGFARFQNLDIIEIIVVGRIVTSVHTDPFTNLEDVDTTIIGIVMVNFNIILRETIKIISIVKVSIAIKT